MISKLKKLIPRKLLSADQQRLICLEKAPQGALRDYLSVPFPEKSDILKDFDILSLDFETTGLDAMQDQLLSIGCVTMASGKIMLSTCHHQIIKTSGKLQKQNVAIHQITDSEKDRGAELKSTLDRLLRLMAGRVVLVHFARIERTFLQEACRQIYGMTPPFLFIDTLAIIKRRFDQKDIHYDPSHLRLGNIREALELPGYFAHNALKDAIATAELLLAEVNKHHQGLDTKLKDLI